MMCHYRSKPVVEIFTQPNTSVTILAPNHYYMINVNQANSFWAHSENTQRSLSKDSFHLWSASKSLEVLSLFVSCYSETETVYKSLSN